MQKLSRTKFYIMNVLSFITLFCPLLPWMSYGVGSKTGIDIGGTSTYAIFVSAMVLIIINLILFKSTQLKKTFLFLAAIIATIIFTLYCYEITKIAYQTFIAKSLPVEMFGVVALSAKQIKIGYGLWLGAVSALLTLIIHYISIKLKN